MPVPPSTSPHPPTSYRQPGCPHEPAVAGQVMAQRTDRAVVHIDVVGWGSSPYDVLCGADIQTEAVNGASKAKSRTRDAGLSFANIESSLIKFQCGDGTVSG